MRSPKRSGATTVVAIVLLALLTACEGSAATNASAPDTVPDTVPDTATAPAPDTAPDTATAPDTVPVPDTVPDTDTATDTATDTGVPPPRTFLAVTFNTGTTEMMGGVSSDDRYTEAHAAASDAWYGDGLAWLPAVEAVRAFFATVSPDVVVFQEIFWSGECPDVPEEARADFVCATWQPGDPTVAQLILGGDYQVMCHPGKPDKCAAVHRRFGTFRGCEADFCLEGLAGATVDGCGRGARVGRGVIDLVDGGTLTLVNVHASSGLTADDQACRVRQFEQVFVDLGDGEPAANGARNLIMGDLNTDPARLAVADESARRFNDFVGEGKPFHFLTAVGADVPPTYGALGNIDHVVSDVLDGTCWTAGVTEGHPTVLEDRYFDHRPAVCTVTLPD